MSGKSTYGYLTTINWFHYFLVFNLYRMMNKFEYISENSHTQLFSRDVCITWLSIINFITFVCLICSEQFECTYLWPNPSQIRWPAYAYVTNYFGIQVFLFFSKNYLTCIFLLFCCNKISCVQQCCKIPRKSLLRNKFFQCYFPTATASSIFSAF